MITFSMFSSECCLLAWWHVIHQRQYTKNVFLILGDVEYTTCNNFIIFDIIKIIFLNNKTVQEASTNTDHSIVSGFTLNTSNII